MRTKSLWSILLAASFALGQGCMKKEADLSEKVISIGVQSKIKGLDPIYANDRYSGNEIGRVYEGLLEYHYLKRPYTLVPNLAVAMPQVSKDGRTYSFTIKKGVVFHDSEVFDGGKGRELVAADVVYSIKRLADPKLQSTGWWVLNGKLVGLNEWREKYSKLPKVDYDEKVEGIRATGKYTVEFKLKKAFPQFLYTLAMPFTFVVAREAVERYGKEFLNHPVGTGPFVLPEFRQTNRITYVKNPSFRDKRFPSEASSEFQSMLADAGKKLPLVDKIVVNVMVESQPRWLKFQKGDVDYLAIPKDNFDSAVTPSDGVASDLAKKGISLQIVPSLDVTYTGFNHDLKLFKNVKLRQAMSLAYDGKKSIELFYSGKALKAQSIVPPGIAGNETSYKSPYATADIEKAKKLLAEAGYPGGKGLPAITYDCPSSSVSRQIGNYFKKRMELIGINIKVQQNPWPELQKKIATRNIMTYGIAWGADYPDAENFLQLLYGPNRAPGANGSGYDNPEFNRLFEIATKMQDSPERTALYEKLNKMAATEVPLLFGVHRKSYTLSHKWLKNYISTDFEIGREQFVNIDLKVKKEILSTL